MKFLSSCSLPVEWRLSACQCDIEIATVPDTGRRSLETSLLALLLVVTRRRLVRFVVSRTLLVIKAIVATLLVPLLSYRTFDISASQQEKNSASFIAMVGFVIKLLKIN
jgi:hypothetical protein